MSDAIKPVEDEVVKARAALFAFDPDLKEISECAACHEANPIFDIMVLLVNVSDALYGDDEASAEDVARIFNRKGGLGDKVSALCDAHKEHKKPRIIL